MAARLVTEVNGVEPGYVPARPVDTISCHDVLQAVRSGQGADLTFHEGPVYRRILGEFERINDAARRAAESVSVLALARHTNTLFEEPPPVQAIADRDKPERC